MSSVSSLNGGKKVRGNAMAAKTAATTAAAAHCEDQVAPRDRPGQQRDVGPLEMSKQESVMVPAAAAREQIVAQDGRQGNRHQETAENRDDVGDAQRREQAAFKARHGKQRHEDKNDDDRRIEHTGADFLARLGDHLQDRARIAPDAVFAEPAQDVLDIDNGIVDEFADRDGEAAQRHRVDRQSQSLECDEGHDKGQRNRRERNEGRSQVHQKNHQNQRHHHGRLDQCPLQAADRRFDEACLAELNVGRRDAGRQRLLHELQGLLNLMGQRHRIGPRLLLDRQDDGLACREIRHRRASPAR